MEYNTNMTVTNGNAATDMASMQEQIADLTNKLNTVNATVERLNVRLEEVRVQRDRVEADFRTLNNYLNDYADNKGYCDEYEKQLDEWNEGLHAMQLHGRIHEYEVEVECTFRYTHTVTVEASSEQDAREQVEQMTASEVMESADWDCPDYEDAEVQSVNKS